MGGLALSDTSLPQKFILFIVIYIRVAVLVHNIYYIYVVYIYVVYIYPTPSQKKNTWTCSTR
jgi:hypothetical protein